MRKIGKGLFWLLVAVLFWLCVFLGYVSTAVIDDVVTLINRRFAFGGGLR